MKAYIHINRQLWRGHEGLHTHKQITVERSRRPTYTQSDYWGEVTKAYIYTNRLH